MILVTGCAGFIGYHLTLKLLSQNKNVYGIDSMNNYYDTNLKYNRLKILKKNKLFKFIKVDISSDFFIKKINKIKPEIIVHLAAQPGVRASTLKPFNTLKNNLNSFNNIIEFARIKNVKKFIYASSSSVYGDTKTFPFTENDKNTKPISVYGSSKLCNEIIASSYSLNFSMPCYGLRFFTVYGPFGRPDMAYYKFAKLNKDRKKIEIYNKGEMLRDFTYITDIVDAIEKIIKLHSKKVENVIVNIGKGKPDKLLNFISLIEKYQKIKILKLFKDSMPLGDIKKTFANTKKLKKLINWKPKVSLETGLKKFITWFESYQ